MAKILFDIAVVREPAEWTGCHIVMEISCQIFSYAVINHNKKLLQLRFYELEVHSNYDMAEELYGIICSDQILKRDAEKKTCVYNFPESQLVPEKYFQTDAGASMIELLHGDLSTGITLNEKMRNRNIYNVYQVPAAIHNLLQSSFPDAQYLHYYTAWMVPVQASASFLSVLFYPNRILVSAVKEKELYLLQSYAYEAAEDVGYYLLNICEQLQFPPASIPVVLSGMIEVSSALYTEIFKYFSQLSLEAFPDLASIPAMEEYPAHFFSPLLKLAECVS